MSIYIERLTNEGTVKVYGRQKTGGSVMARFTTRNINEAVERASTQATRWGGSWVAHEIEPGVFGVKACSLHTSEDGPAIFCTCAPAIGNVANGEYTPYGEKLREKCAEPVDLSPGSIHVIARPDCGESYHALLTSYQALERHTEHVRTLHDELRAENEALRTRNEDLEAARQSLLRSEQKHWAEFQELRAERDRLLDEENALYNQLEASRVERDALLAEKDDGDIAKESTRHWHAAYLKLLDQFNQIRAERNNLLRKLAVIEGALT